MVNEEDIWKKLQEMDNKLDLIQGDVNTQATVMKEDNKEQLMNLAKRKFGRSKNKRIIWHYADKKRNVGEISDVSSLSESSIYNKITEMCEQGLIFKIEDGDITRYKRQETTEGIGLEEHVEDYVDDL